MGQGEIYEHILYRQDGPVAFIEFNRPKVMNALNAKLIDEMTSAFDAIPSDVRVLIVRGAGDKAFAAGADLVELEERTIWTELEYGPRRALAARLEKGPVITVAALNGLALGGGFELALACHLRIASDAAELGLPELRLGLIPGNGGTIRLPRIVGTSIALQKLLGRGSVAPGARQLGRAGGRVRRRGVASWRKTGAAAGRCRSCRSRLCHAKR